MQEILSKTTYTNKFINFNSINNQKESITVRFLTVKS